MARFRLALLAPDHLDGTSWYRAAGPLAHLARFIWRELEFVPLLEPAGWSSFMFCDAIFIQRPHSPQSLDWIRRANDMRIPIWMDVDDDLQALSPSHNSFLPYQTIKEDIKEIFKRSTIISVSTRALADKIQSQTDATVVHVPNAVDETLLHYSPPKTLDPKFLVWRGSNTHREDVELARRLFTRPDIKMHYWGHVPPWLRSGDTITPWLPMNQYMRELAYCDAGAMVVPLVDNEFNRARSNCSWLEATWAGMATAHFTDKGTDQNSMLPEFSVPGVMALDTLLGADITKLGKWRENSLCYIRDHLTLAKINPLRRELLQSL